MPITKSEGYSTDPWFEKAFKAHEFHLKTLSFAMPKEAKKLLMELSTRSRDAYLHSLRTGRAATAVALYLGWTPEEVRDVGIVSDLHDIGKLPLVEYFNNGKHIGEEIQIMHTEIGFFLLEEVYPPAAFGALTHHIIKLREGEKPYPVGVNISKNHPWFHYVDVLSASDRFDAAVTRFDKNPEDVAEELVSLGFSRNYTDALVGLYRNLPPNSFYL